MARPPALLLRLAPFVCAGLLASGSAAGAPTPAEEEADRLFREANDLVGRGAYDDACPKLERSQELDPGVGTQFNLADCYEHTLRLARAYRLFQEVERIAQASGKRERAAQAQKRAALLAPRVPRVTIVLTDARGAAEVRLDGAPITMVSGPLLVEPGTHAVSVLVPGKTPWQGTVFAEESKAVELVVPELDRAPSLHPPTAPGATAGRPNGLGSRTIAGVAAVGLGVVGIGLGTYFGIASYDRHGDAVTQCPVRNACPTREGVDAWHDATSLGTYSTIAFGVGALSTVVGAVLWITAPSSTASSRTALHVTPNVARDGAGLTVGGAWY